LDASTLQRELGRLVEAEIVYQRGLPPQAHYFFKHALIQDAAYESLLKSTRQQYHQRIAQVLEEQFPETTQAQPEFLAHHYTEAGLTGQAVAYWYKAGQSASERSAHVEAISHLTKGLALLQTLPETPERLQCEVDMLITLGTSLMRTRGFASPEVERAYARARALCQHLAETPQLFQVLEGLVRFHQNRAEFQTVRTLGQQLLELAQRLQDPIVLLVSHFNLGAPLFWLGELHTARVHFEQSLTLYARQQDRSFAMGYGIVSLIYIAHVLWSLGYPDQALQRCDEALTLSQALSHPFTLVQVLNWTARLHHCRRETQAASKRIEVAIPLATEYGFTHLSAISTMMQGWVLTEQGWIAEGIAQLRQGLTTYQSTGAVVQRPYFLALLVEAYRNGEQIQEALTVLAKALTLVNQTGERWYKPELYRLKGTLLLQQTSDNQAEAETYFQHALDIARNQQAKSFELRSATSLARLWQCQGKRQEAHDLLALVYGWFTEGFDTADLKDAKALLEELT
jgi:predicted ATPase